MELIAQGVANFISPLMGGLPATGAIARTATNIRSGAKTPVAGMIHALTLLAILMFATPVAKFIPLAVLAAILLVVSYNMGEWAEIPELLKLSRLEVACWSATFVLTVFADLTVAVEAGMILAALVFHPQGHGYDNDFTRDERISGREQAARAPGQGNSAVCDGVSHPWAFSVWRGRQN